MTWVATESFEGYTVGVDLADQSVPGGSGWAGGWTDNGIGHWTAENLGGSRVARCGANTNNTHAYRTLATPAADGALTWRMRIDVTNPSDFAGVTLDEGAPDGSNARCYIAFAGDGLIKIYDNASGYISLGVAYSANTWYTIALQFDAVTNKYRAKVDSGPWSAWVLVNTATLTTITHIRLDCSSVPSPTVELLVDDIQPYFPSPARVPGRRIQVT